jgi:hypothetical protein
LPCYGVQRFTTRRFNLYRNGYRMACKPPGCRQLKPRLRFPAPACSRSRGGGRERTRGRVRAWPGDPRQVEVPLSAPAAADGRCLRNAVGRVGVKLVAALDAPHWGEVLARTPSDRFSSARRRATSKFSCPSRESPVCPADTGGSGGSEPRRKWPASGGGGRDTGRQPAGGRPVVREQETRPGRSERPGWRRVAAGTTQQRAVTVFMHGHDPRPGKDPL